MGFRATRTSLGRGTAIPDRVEVSGREDATLPSGHRLLGIRSGSEDDDAISARPTVRRIIGVLGALLHGLAAWRGAGLPVSAVWQELTQHIVALRRYALALTRNSEEAEDLVQESLSRAIAAAATWQEGTSLRTWLFRILHNAHVDGLRRKKVRSDAAKQGMPGVQQDPSQLVRMEVRDVLAALAKLPEPQRQAIVLVALEDLRYEEAAALLGIPIGTFMSRLARGREALRRILETERAPRLRVVGGRE